MNIDDALADYARIFAPLQAKVDSIVSSSEVLKATRALEAIRASMTTLAQFQAVCGTPPSKKVLAFATLDLEMIEPPLKFSDGNRLPAPRRRSIVRQTVTRKIGF